MDGPKHGYQIKKLIREIAVKYASIDSTSIYYPLNRMKKAGLLSESRIKKTGRLEKFVYRITKNGKNTFKKLFYKNFLLLERPFINTDVSLYFLNYADKEMLSRRIKQRIRWLKRIAKWLSETENNLREGNKKLSHILIIKHNLELIKTEIKFSRYLINAIYQGLCAKNEQDVNTAFE